MSEVHNPKTDVQSPQSEVWCTKSDEIRSLMSDVCPKTVWIMSKVWSTTYVCSKPGVQKLKSEVQNPNLKLQSEVCQLFEVWNRSPESNAKNSKFEVENLKSKVCLKYVQSFLQLL